MTNPETPTPAHDRADPERLDAGEIDLTGSTHQSADLADVIGDAFIQAEASGGELPEWGARAVARSLADHCEGPATALHDFAVSGDGDLEAISREAMPVYNQADTSPWVRRQIDYLLTFLLNVNKASDTAETPSTTDATETVGQTLTAQAIEGINQHGDAFRAFMELPDTDQHDPNLIDNFHEFYVGRFANMDELLDGLTEIALWTREIGMLAERLGIPGDITLDLAAVEAHARDVWDIVAYHGALYAFDK
jgi:hypothetical protein